MGQGMNDYIHCIKTEGLLLPVWVTWVAIVLVNHFTATE